MKNVRRNEPCPCGSGKKYKHCCYSKNFTEVNPNKKNAYFTAENGSKISHKITSIDSIPSHNKNGLTPNITSHQMMDLCLDEIYKILQTENVGMVHDLVDKIILDMDIVPTFTYREIAERMGYDGRFEVFQSQICSLKGTDPISLMSEKFNF
jgi:hypothetical protein